MNAWVLNALDLLASITVWSNNLTTFKQPFQLMEVLPAHVVVVVRSHSFESRIHKVAVEIANVFIERLAAVQLSTIITYVTTNGPFSYRHCATHCDDIHSFIQTLAPTITRLWHFR